MREAGSGLNGKYNKHLTKNQKQIQNLEQPATWFGILKKRSSEVIAALSRRNIDICGIQEHRWSGGLMPNQTRLLTGKKSKLKFCWCGLKHGHGGTVILLSEIQVQVQVQVLFFDYMHSEKAFVNLYQILK